MRISKMSLIVLTLVGTLGLATPSTSQFALDTAGETIDGTWIVEPNLIGGATGVQQLTTYMRGTVTANGNAAGPTLRSPWQGTYVKSAYRDFAATIVRWNFDAAGNFTGRTEELQAITVDPTLNEFSGRLRQFVFDVAGNLTRTREGTLRATRVGVKAIE